jgi:hypothetical protein
MQTLATFPLFYLPPTTYFSALKAHNFNFIMEREEHFVKQTYRNRASIASPNGILDLIVPVVKGSKIHTSIKDVKISYDSKWQRLHWLSLQTCYRSSAYFEYYEDEFASFYHKKYDFLFDYNLELLNWIFKQLKQSPDYSFTSEYQKELPLGFDYRTELNNKKKLSQHVDFKKYFQVFSDRNEFIPNLSCIDLLFNQGPQTKSHF